MSPSTSGGIKDLFYKSTYRPSATTGGRGIVLNQLSTLEFVNKLSFDFERFALASQESYAIAVSESIESSSIGWPLLKFYYSSFFAAHAIMRSRGAGFINLDKDHAQMLNDVVEAYSIGSEPLQPGAYVFRQFSDSGNQPGQLSIEILPNSYKGGVHEGFWKSFCKYLESESKLSLQNGEIDAAWFLVRATELSDAILTSPQDSGVWLSSTRNRINYEHKYDTWLPRKKSSESSKAFDQTNVSTIKSFRLDIHKDSRPIEAFIHINCYLSNIAFSISEFVAKNSTKGGAFGQKWRKLNELISPT